MIRSLNPAISKMTRRESRRPDRDLSSRAGSRIAVQIFVGTEQFVKGAIFIPNLSFSMSYTNILYQNKGLNN